MATEKKTPVLHPGDEWHVPKGSIITTPSGKKHTVGGEIWIVQETGVHSNDTGDRIIVEAP